MLDPQRAQNIGIGLYQFKKQGGAAFLVDALRKMKASALTLAQVDALRDALLPDAKEAKAAAQ